ncbi:hypothetical protein [Streptomyces sp. NPDC097640]
MKIIMADDPTPTTSARARHVLLVSLRPIALAAASGAIEALTTWLLDR